MLLWCGPHCEGVVPPSPLLRPIPAAAALSTRSNGIHRTVATGLQPHHPAMSASMMHHVRSLSDTPALPMREFRGTGACATTVPAPAAPAVAMEASIDIDNSTFMKRSLSSGNMRPREGAEVPVSSLLGSHAAGKSFASLESVIKVRRVCIVYRGALDLSPASNR